VKKPDSRIETIVEKVSPYVTSAPVDPDYPWGQPPASHYVFIDIGSTLRGQPVESMEEVYIHSSYVEYPFAIEPELDLEFRVWDALSDEALLNFEKELD
jgi:hypothetical protein